MSESPAAASAANADNAIPAHVQNFNALLTGFASALAARFPDSPSMAALPGLVNAGTMMNPAVPALEFGNAQNPFMLEIRSAIRRRDAALFTESDLAGKWPLLRQLNMKSVWTPELDEQTKDSIWQYLEGMDRLADAAAIEAFGMPEPDEAKLTETTQGVLDQMQEKMRGMSSEQVAAVTEDATKWIKRLAGHPVMKEFDLGRLLAEARETPSGKQVEPILLGLQASMEEQAGETGEGLTGAAMDKIKAVVEEVGSEKAKDLISGVYDELGGLPGMLTVLTGSQQKAVKIIQNPLGMLKKMQGVVNDVRRQYMPEGGQGAEGEGASEGQGEQESQASTDFVAMMREQLQQVKHMIPPEYLPALAGLGIDVGDPEAAKSGMAYAGRAAASMMNIPDPQMAKGRLKGKARTEAKKKAAEARKKML